MNYSVVIPAAGQGKRMRAGKNKQFIFLKNEPIIIHTLRVFIEDSWCRRIVLVVNKDDRREMEKLISTFKGEKPIELVDGGSERQQSVKCGIDAIFDTRDEEKEEIVLVHDGARPFIKQEVIHRLVQAAVIDKAATVAVPMKDTVKRVRDMTVVETMDRSELWSIQTPQAFQLVTIKEAHDKAEDANQLGTDDASLIEWAGRSVTIVEGDYTNIKLTTPEDLLFAEAILAHKERV
ncbi:2-C-methyl-D-erythritol 4-phosphate cytidylyltransferase [Alkalihalophilus pseudofirmus]|uniref:2-C-methyl-D-erythritol 4-phosphate cytidylyltransferase n=1 Tax=Alkalihalophilus pseudofirmus TaxID=79885 RepID=A0AAJ2NRH7_ALKPS|nr:2-C-methyl-D-erythritol 4-phosphate cytidylyltransferase [Alkalihalophilus pseudofirmus]MDV2887271.1 2-C-methyl-D-erythritol 4-phosphate cytidylyltransferase [Alkalihalophilus pseudofirmus]